MELVSWRTVAEAQAAVDRCLRMARDGGLDVRQGDFLFGTGGGRLMGHPWRTNYLVVVTVGTAWAVQEDGSRAVLWPGQAAFWPTGEWFAVDIPEGFGAEALTLEGDDLGIDHLRTMSAQRG